MSDKNTLDTEYFNQVYAASDDPWDFETSEYEAGKYAATLAALPKNNYKNALEIGCSIGVLTKLLAQKCTSLLATDVSQKALNKAKERCKNLINVTFKKSSFAEDLGDQIFDLVVISEVAYYLSTKDWERAIFRIEKSIEIGSQIILVHWLPEVHDYPQTGDEVHDLFNELMTGKMINIFNDRQEKYRIDVWEKIAD